MAVRFLVDRIYNDTMHYVECAGLHDDSKPTGGFVTGSKFFEADTGDTYTYDDVGAQWAKTSAGPTAATE